MKKVVLLILSIINFGLMHRVHAMSAQDLVRAAQKGDIAGLEVCLAVHVDLNVSDADGNLAVVAAAREGNLLAVKWLCEHDADIAASEDFGDSALHATAREGHVAVIAYLLSKGIAVDCRDKFITRETPLMRAVQSGQLEAVSFLVDHGADVNAHCSGGFTPLSLSIMCAQPEIMKYLIKDAHCEFCDTHIEVALCNVKKYLRQTPLSDIVQKKNLQEIFDYLAPFEERRSILAALLACASLGCAKDKDFPPELMAKGWPFAAIIESLVCRDGK